MPTFSDFKWKYLFWTNLFQKSELQFKQKFGSYTNSNMKDSTVMFVFGEKLFQNIKIVEAEL